MFLFFINHVFSTNQILDPELLIATRAPDYHSVVESSSTMLSTDYFRNNVQPLGVNTSLNRHEDSRFGSSSFGSYGNSQDHVPVDRPLFVNTSMSASQRVDLYRRLSDPPKDNEPALTFNYRGY
ncbi:unnamed protein product [Caenorhabditis angaria]|uniref:Uncharacterized protein n=1 Tax=Caenorhabditis angaria TaxID=860376 RepID=A0A9P1IZJ1_9PELO|nr:unnamed protein product [Caenorhabditis angaria]